MQIDAESFQSAPAIDGGRSALTPMATSAISLFQSAPAIDGGRSWPSSSTIDWSVLFQSAPAIDGGRSDGQRVMPQHGVVSIRARHRWRAIQGAVRFCR